MNNHSLPLYAIVELLIRVSAFHQEIGDYKDHLFGEGLILVKTTKGTIAFSNDLIGKQFLTPGEITKEELSNTFATFNPEYV